MNPALAKKAAHCIVVPFPSGKAFRVGGATQVYDVYEDMISGNLRCSCPARSRCSHLMAVTHFQSNRENQHGRS